MALTTLAAFKTYANVTGTDDDALITALITRAQAEIENYCDRKLESDVFREFISGDRSFELILKQYPVTSVESLSISRTEGIQITNTSADASTAYVVVTETDELSTNLTLVVRGGTNDGESSLPFAARGTYTLGTLVTAINALGSGWSATLSAPAYTNIDAVELIPDMGFGCLDQFVYLRIPEDYEYQFTVDKDTAIIKTTRRLPMGKDNVIAVYTAGYTTVPNDLEQICIDVTNTYYQNRTVVGAVESERLGDHTIKYTSGVMGSVRGISVTIEERLAPYRRWALK